MLGERELGITIGMVSQCHFYHKRWQVCGLVLNAIADNMAWEGKVNAAMVGPGVPGVLRVLNRSTRWTRHE